ncbi:hypothetical protein CI109_106236 [Kwoniella shandongensis]|uniref:Uncharacterized protein n=1 Tax=Kwoniella shandongensis TaxID=1734106 RepID=A0A5M6BYD8_9TREE|nr:uncharacterized protein CI109_003840 [Kwoniella shandongensis]KAA5527868.1 hypothetical protein CI109_003840 [Kwoniella shandongensis]
MAATKSAYQGPNHLPIELKWHIFSSMYKQDRIRALLNLSRCSKGMNLAYTPLLDAMIYDDVVVNERTAGKLIYGLNWKQPESPGHKRKLASLNKIKKLRVWDYGGARVIARAFGYSLSSDLVASTNKQRKVRPVFENVTTLVLHNQFLNESLYLGPNDVETAIREGFRPSTVCITFGRPQEWRSGRSGQRSGLVQERHFPSISQQEKEKMFRRLMSGWNMDQITWHLGINMCVIQPCFKAKNLRIYCDPLRRKSSLSDTITRVYNLISPMFYHHTNTAADRGLPGKIEYYNQTWPADLLQAPVKLTDLIDKKIKTLTNKNVKEDIMKIWHGIDFIDQPSRLQDACQGCGRW